MSNFPPSETSPSSKQGFVPESIWDLSPLPAFRINEEQKIVAGNTALKALITNPMAFYPGKSLMTWLGLANTELFYEWCQVFLKGDQKSNLILEVNDVSSPLVLFEVIPLGKELVVRSLPYLPEQKHEVQPVETNNFFKELRGYISHDLRAPIRQLRLYTQKILTYSKSKISADVLEDLVFLNNSSGKLLQRFESLALLVANEGQPLEHTHIELLQLVRIASGTFSLHLQDTNGEIRIGSLPGVVADQKLLMGIVVEILNNAVAHIPPDRAPVILVDSKESEAGVFILFQDNGIGFDNQQANNVFSAFTSVHEVSQGENTGPGMGLTIAKRAAERMGMTLTASGKKDRGAIFCLEVPRHLIPA